MVGGIQGGGRSKRRREVIRPSPDSSTEPQQPTKRAKQGSQGEGDCADISTEVEDETKAVTSTEPVPTSSSQEVVQEEACSSSQPESPTPPHIPLGEVKKAEGAQRCQMEKVLWKEILKLRKGMKKLEGQVGEKSIEKKDVKRLQKSKAGTRQKAGLAQKADMTQESCGVEIAGTLQKACVTQKACDVQESINVNKLSDIQQASEVETVGDLHQQKAIVKRTSTVQKVNVMQKVNTVTIKANTASNLVETEKAKENAITKQKNIPISQKIGNVQKTSTGTVQAARVEKASNLPVHKVSTGNIKKSSQVKTPSNVNVQKSGNEKIASEVQKAKKPGNTQKVAKINKAISASPKPPTVKDGSTNQAEMKKGTAGAQNKARTKTQSRQVRTIKKVDDERQGDVDFVEINESAREISGEVKGANSHNLKLITSHNVKTESVEVQDSEKEQIAGTCSELDSANNAQEHRNVEGTEEVEREASGDEGSEMDWVDGQFIITDEAGDDDEDENVSGIVTVKEEIEDIDSPEDFGESIKAIDTEKETAQLLETNTQVKDEPQLKETENTAQETCQKSDATDKSQEREATDNAQDIPQLKETKLGMKKTAQLKLKKGGVKKETQVKDSAKVVQLKVKKSAKVAQLKVKKEVKVQEDQDNKEANIEERDKGEHIEAKDNKEENVVKSEDTAEDCNPDMDDFIVMDEVFSDSDEEIDESDIISELEGAKIEKLLAKYRRESLGKRPSRTPPRKSTSVHSRLSIPHQPREGENLLSFTKPGELISNNDVRHEQWHDPFLANVRKMLNENATDVEGNTFVKMKNSIYLNFTSRKGNNGNLFVVPFKYRESVCNWAHYTPEGEHNLQEVILSRIKSIFFWPGMKEYVDEFCAKCDLCEEREETGGQLRVYHEPEIARTYRQSIGPRKWESVVLIGHGSVVKFKEFIKHGSVHSSFLTGERAARALEVHNIVNKVYIEGIPGGTVPDLPTDLQSYDPSLVVIDCGINDLTAGRDPVCLAEELVALGRRLAAECQCHVLISTIVHQQNGLAAKEQKLVRSAIDVYNKNLKTLTLNESQVHHYEALRLKSLRKQWQKMRNNVGIKGCQTSLRHDWCKQIYFTELQKAIRTWYMNDYKDYV